MGEVDAWEVGVGKMTLEDLGAGFEDCGIDGRVEERCGVWIWLIDESGWIWRGGDHGERGPVSELQTTRYRGSGEIEAC